MNFRLSGTEKNLEKKQDNNVKRIMTDAINNASGTERTNVK